MNILKNLTIAILLLISTTAMAQRTIPAPIKTTTIKLVIPKLVNGNRLSFCRGFKDGHNAGNYERTKSIGLAPLCPIQPIKSVGSPSNDYTQGFAIGHKKGLKG